MKLGEFDSLAEEYGKYRPGYAPVVADMISRFAKKDGEVLQHADVGAGTGIWTRMIAERGADVTAVEPSDPMREKGIELSQGMHIKWMKGSAEETGLPSDRFDLVTMASSFHWPDYDKATQEFHRILKSGGVFMALWNTRYLEANPLLVEIEEELKRIVPDLKRVSSGRSEFTADLLSRLNRTPGFGEAFYVESRHIEYQSQERYLGLWRSVNDIRVQAGEDRFGKFLDFIRDRIKNEEHIEATYLTRAWVARRQ